MTPENFTYWLQGFIEISNPKVISEEQTQIIKDHLNLVFKKETPNTNIKLPRTIGISTTFDMNKIHDFGNIKVNETYPGAQYMWNQPSC